MSVGPQHVLRGPCRRSGAADEGEATLICGDVKLSATPNPNPEVQLAVFIEKGRTWGRTFSKVNEFQEIIDAPSGGLDQEKPLHDVARAQGERVLQPTAPTSSSAASGGTAGGRDRRVRPGMQGRLQPTSTVARTGAALGAPGALALAADDRRAMRGADRDVLDSRT